MLADVRAGAHEDSAAAPVAARAALARLSAAAFLAYCSYAMCRLPLLPLFARELGAAPALIGIVMAASTTMGVLAKLPAGACSDIFGRRPLLLAGALVFATLPFTYLGVASIGALILLRFIHGSATAIFGPVASAAVSDLAAPAKRGTWLATYTTVQNAGAAVGPVLAGYLIAAGRFDVAFLTAGAIALAAPLIISRWPSSDHAGPRRVSWREFTTGVAEVARDRLVLATSAAQAAQFVLHGSLSAFLPLYGRDVLGMSAAQLGWLFATQTVTTLATRPLIGFLSDRAGRRWIIASGIALCGAAVMMIPAAASVAQFVIAVVAYAVGVGTTHAAASAFITDITRRARYGAAHGVFGTIYDIGDASGPIAAGLLVAAFGYAAMFRSVAAVALIAAVAFVFASRRGATRERL